MGLIRGRLHSLIPLALISGFILWIGESSYLLFLGELSRRWGMFDLLLTLSQSLALFLFAAILIGVLEVGAVWVCCVLASLIVRKHKQRAGRMLPFIKAGLVTMLCFPLIVIFSLELFKGKGISRTWLAAPGPYIATVLFIILIFLSSLIILNRERDYRQHGRLPRFKSLLQAAFLGGMIPFLYYADSHFYVFLYPYIHYALLGVQFVLLQVVIALIYGSLKDSRTGYSIFIARPRYLLSVCLTVLMAYSFLSWRLYMRGELLAFIFNRTVIEKKLLNIFVKASLFPHDEPDIKGPLAVEDRDSFAEPLYVRSMLSSVARGMNVLLITIDSLRSDSLSYGAEKDSRTCNIDSLSRNGFVFPNTFLQSRPYTMFGTASLFSSTVQLGGEKKRFVPTLTTLLRQNGYETIRCTPLILDAYATYPATSGFVRDAARDFVRGKITAAKYKDWMTDEAANQALRQCAGKKFFLWVHYLAPHSSIRKEIPSEYKTPGGNDKQLYHDAIAYADELVGRLLDTLEETGVDQRTIVVIASDHGEGHGEHVATYHVDKLYDEFIRLPLIIYLPGIGGDVLTQNVGMMDLAPTLLDLIGVKPPTEFYGRSLLRYCLPKFRNREEDVFCAVMNGFALIRGGWKLIYNAGSGTYELYNRRNDPGERFNLIGACPLEAKELKEALAEAMVRYGVIPELPQGFSMGEKDALAILGEGEKHSIEEKLTALRVIAHTVSRDRVAESLEKFIRVREPAMRREAAFLIGEMGVYECGEELYARLDEEKDYMARLEIIQAIGKLRPRGVVEDLLKLLDDERDMVLRRTVIRTLGEVGDNRSGQYLINLLKEEEDPTYDSETISVIIESLVKMNTQGTINAVADYMALLGYYLSAGSPLVGGDEEYFGEVTELRDFIYEKIAHYGNSEMAHYLWEGVPKHGYDEAAAYRLALIVALCSELSSYYDFCPGIISRWYSVSGEPVAVSDAVGPLGFKWVVGDDCGVRNEKGKAVIETGIEAGNDKSVVLLFFYRGPVELWLNGRKVVEKKNACPSSYVDYLTACAKLQLKGGENSLIVRMQPLVDRWGFGAVLLHLPQERERIGAHKL